MTIDQLVPLRRGDIVRLRIDRESVNGMVVMASPNGHSVMVMFDAILDGCVGMIPLGYCTSPDAMKDPHYHNVVTGTRVDVDRQLPAAVGSVN